MANKGKLIVISGPSGVGKGTVIKRILSECKNLKLSVSATTREPREEDTEGVTYYFKTKDDFRAMIDNDEFLEWAVYNDNYYGTPIASVERQRENGIDVLLEIDVQGAINIMDRCNDAKFIFIAPPSFDTLRERLCGRGSEKAEEIENRVAAAHDELKMKEKYDYIVVNDILDTAVREIIDIIEGKDVL